MHEDKVMVNDIGATLDGAGGSAARRVQTRHGPTRGSSASTQTLWHSARASSGQVFWP